MKCIGRSRPHENPAWISHENSPRYLCGDIAPVARVIVIPGFPLREGPALTTASRKRDVFFGGGHATFHFVIGKTNRALYHKIVLV